VVSKKRGRERGKEGMRGGALNRVLTHLFFSYQKIGNSYLLRVGVAFKDLLCDGRPDGISAQLFRAHSERVRANKGMEVNSCWLEEEEEEEGEGGREGEKKEGRRLEGCLALGHLINDPKGSEYEANVVFKATRLTADSSPPSLPPSLLPLLPSLSASGDNQVERVVVVVVAMGGMEGGKEGKELFVNYGQDPLSVGYV
jgi:hypothetical protein